MNGRMNSGEGSQCGMRDRISAYDFAMWEMTLYLDTHPNDGEAMELMEAYRRKRGELMDCYERRFGPWVTASHEVRGDRWSWVDSPWPWEGKE